MNNNINYRKWKIKILSAIQIKFIICIERKEKRKMIYIVRHGQTNYNVEGRYGGRIDTELNQKGIEQAYELHEKLKNIQFDKVFSSNL